MKQTALRLLGRSKTALAGYTIGQRITAAVGAIALLVGAGLLIRWVTAPSYTMLYGNLSGADASSVLTALQKDNISYKLTDGGSTVMVPKQDVYTERVKLAGEGIPSTSDGSSSGYSILDKESISTSEFQENTDYKRAMEGELQNTIEAMNGVQTAVVHLAIPTQSAFTDDQDPTTASVLIKTDAGQTLTSSQVQAIVNLVSSSVSGLKANEVTVADAAGNVLSVAGGSGSNAGSATTATNTQAVSDFQDTMTSKIQKLLDTVVGPGNSAVTVTANLNFDTVDTTTRSYFYDKTPPLSQQSSKETYKNGSGSSGSSGVVGADGQMESSGSTAATSGTGDYIKESSTQDNSVGTKVEHRIAAPGGVDALHVGVVLNQKAKSTVGIQNQIYSLLSSGIGINTKRGDTIDVSTLAFDTTAQKTAAKQLAAQQKAETRSHWISVGRNVLIVLAIVLILLIAMRRMRKREKARQEAADILVQQLRDDRSQSDGGAAVEAGGAALAALEQAEHDEDEQMRDELAALVESQPEEVASLLRGWLVERH